ncbi:hypothetical protein GCM10023353_18200 [Tomitella cavernea]|uniref:Uncharacterized protein n=1 Tax=Tomitella cavernea TaxID=1387982 RepID=A0ABP9CQ62_9ACTN
MGFEGAFALLAPQLHLVTLLASCARTAGTGNLGYPRDPVAKPGVDAGRAGRSEGLAGTVSRQIEVDDRGR